MKNSYFQYASLAWFFRLASAFLLCLAIGRVLLPAIPLFATGSPAGSFGCSSAHGCHVTAEPERLLPQELQGNVRSSPELMAKLTARIQEPKIMAGLIAAEVALLAPIVLFWLCIAAALWRLGGDKAGALSAVRLWLKRGAGAALAGAILTPLALSVKAMLVIPAAAPRALYFTLDGGTLIYHLGLFVACVLTLSILSAAGRAERELEEFV